LAAERASLTAQSLLPSYLSRTFSRLTYRGNIPLIVDPRFVKSFQLGLHSKLVFRSIELSWACPALSLGPISIALDTIPY
jgi:hypothetical protein